MKPKNAQDYVLKLLQEKAQDVVLSLGETDKVQVKFNNHKISIVKRWNDVSLSVFIAKNRKTVSTTFESFDRNHLNERVKQILSFLQHASINEDYVGIPEGPFHYPRVSIYDKELVNKSKIVSHVEKGLDAVEKEGCHDAAGVLEFADFKSRLLTSQNVDLEEKGTNCYYSIRAFADSDASGYGNAVSTHMKDLNTKKIAAFAADIAVKAKNPGKLNPGKYPVLFYPYPFSNIMEHIGYACSTYSVESGYSCFTGKKGQKVASSNFTLKDDHLKVHGLNTERSDDEGYPCQTTTLIKKGILKTFLHNHSTSQKYKEKNTGNAGIIGPGPSNVVVEGGTKTKSELLKGFTGVVVTNTWYTRFQNYMTGEFSTIPRDGIFLMKDGEIVRPVNGIRISDNLIHILKNIQHMTKKTEQQYGWEIETPIFAPYAIVKDVKLTKSTG